MTAGIKSPADARVGDTVLSARYAPTTNRIAASASGVPTALRGEDSAFALCVPTAIRC